MSQDDLGWQMSRVGPTLLIFNNERLRVYNICIIVRKRMRI